MNAIYTVHRTDPDGRDGSEELVEVLGTDADEALAEA